MKIHIRVTLVIAVAMMSSWLCLTSTLPFPTLVWADADVPPRPGDPQLYDWLVGEEAAAMVTPMRVEVTQAELDAVSERHEPLRVGLTKPLDADVSFAQLVLRNLTARGQPVARGVIRANGSGFVWNAAVQSSGAQAMRLQFENFYLPRKALLYLYDDYGDVAGPYMAQGPNGDGEFWSHTLRGDRVYLQVRYDGADTARVLRALRLSLGDVGHFTRGPFGGTEQSSTELCADNASCVLDADYAGGPEVATARNAVARITWVSGVWIYLCSGGLIADTDPNSDIPLFLTANHCISRDRAARNVEAWFNFSGDEECGNLFGPWGPSTLGASVRATGSGGDFSVLQLAEPAPAGTQFLTWNATDITGENGTQLYRISHPQGSPQAYSEHAVDANAETCIGWPRGERIYSADVAGATEGGSSGAPVVNANGEIVGQLSGCCGYNCGDVCDTASNSTVDGALSFWIAAARDVLDPNTSCTDADGDLVCVENDDCNDSDPSIYPGAAEDCTDGVDNDCDGFVDGADPDCSATCDLGQNKDSCSTGDDCCSGNCRGGQCRGNG